MPLGSGDIRSVTRGDIRSVTRSDRSEHNNTRSDRSEHNNTRSERSDRSDRSIAHRSQSEPYARIEPIPRNRFSGYQSRQPPYRPRPAYKEKVSHGVACCRLYGNRPQILMIQKRYTYAFSAFVHGVYECGSDRSIIQLLNCMTVDEKIILQTLNYAQIWAYVWLTPPSPDSQKYRHLKTKFDSAFARSNGMRLIDLIARSTHGSRVWEIPKGRPRKNESDIHCAVREFYEETGIEKSQYFIFPNATRTHSFIDENVHYVQKYYIAVTHRQMQPRIRLDARMQIEEVADIRWLSIEEIRVIDTSGRLERLVRPVFNYVKKHTNRAADIIGGMRV